MASAVHYVANLRKHTLIVTLVLTVCWSMGNADNTISGSGLFDDCTSPQNVNVSLNSPTANVTVTWDLPLVPFDCMYNYTVMFTVGSTELVEATTQLLTDEEITDCRLLIPPSTLRSDLNMFEPGVTVIVTISLVDGNSCSGSVDIPGVFAPPVTNFSVATVTSMSLTLRWDLAYDPAVPTSYNISYTFRDLSGNAPVQGPITEIVSENNTLDVSSSDLAVTYVVNDLQAYNEYNFTLTAIYGENNISTSVTTTGQTTESAPTSPLNFNLMRVTDQPSQLNASWSSPMDSNGILRNYSVSCCVTLEQFYSDQVPSNLTDFMLRTSTDGDTTSTIIMGLDPFTMYQCQVTASTDAGESPVSNSDNATTDEAAPTQPVGLSVTNRTATSISLQWSRPIPTNGIITTYTLTYTDGSISDTIDIPVEFVPPSEYNVTTITVDSLNEFTNYTFNLSTTTGGGTGPVAILPDVLTSEAVPSAAPVDVTGMNMSSTSLRISWLPPPAEDQNGIITAYNITYTAAGGNEMIDSTSGSVQLIELTGLLKFSTYNISVAASTSVGIGPSESVTVSTDTDVPSAPLGVQYTNLSSTSIQVTWDPPSDINGVFQRYIIMVTRLEPRNSSNQTLDTSNVNVTMFNITGLEEYERYTIVVYGETDAGVGPGSEPLDVLTEEGVPGLVQEPNAAEINSTTITVSWREPLDSNGIIIVYEVEYTLNVTNRQNFSDSELTTSNETFSNGLYTVRIGNLQAFGEYEISVRAYTIIGPGSFSSAITVITDPTAPLEPTNVTAFALNSTATILRWSYPETPNGPILGYIIRTNASFSSQFPNVEVISGGQLNFTLQQLNNMSDQNLVFNNLAPFTTYFFSIRALAIQNADNNSDFIIHEGVSSPEVTATTDEEAPTVPLSFNLEQVTDQSGQLNASWSSPMDSNGILRNYSVLCRITLEQDQVPSNLTDFMLRTSTDGDTTSTIIMGLDPFTMYQCQVTASTDAGESPVSNSDNATTDEAAPTQPVGLSVTNRTATSISLQWSRPIPTNGIITTYTLTYTDGSISDTVDIPVEFVPPSEYNVTTITVNNLNEFTNYTFNLSATTGGGTGPAATLPDVLTSEAVPSAAPVNVTGMNMSSTSLSISWLPPPAEDQNGIITAYNITYTAAGGSEMIDSTSGSVQLIELTGLLKFSTYNISVAASTSVGIGPSESVTVSTDTDVPSAPLGVQYTNLSSTSIQVTWDPPSDINGVFQRYIIMVTRLEPRNSSNQTLDTSNVNVTMFNITGLEEYERYTIVVYGETDAGVGPGSEPLDVLTEEGVPGLVQEPNAAEINSTTITVSWREPLDSNGIIIVYEVEYTLNVTNRQNFSDSELTTSNETFSNGLYTVRIGNLQAFGEYEISVRAYTIIGPGSFSSAITVITDPTAPLEPTNVTAFALNSTATILRWSYPETPNGPILGYIIRTNASFSSQFPNVEVISGGQLNFTLQQLNNMSDQNLVFNNLAPFTTYFFSIRALAIQNADNNSDFIIHEGVSSPEVTATTDEEAPTVPLSFNLEQVTDQSGQLNASWSSPMDSNGILRNYSVLCRITLEQDQVPSNLTDFMLRTSTDGDTTSTIIMGLDPFTMYQCQVTASTDAGESPVSNSDNATTDEAAPTQPVGLSVTNRTATSISLQWSRPIPTNGIITTYTLTYTDGSISDTVDIPVEFVPPSEYNVTTITVNNLNEFTNYTFNLSATTGGGTGPAATLPDVLTSEAVPSAAPVNVTGMNMSSTSLSINWLPPPAEDQNGIITAYNITYTAAGGNEMIDSTSGSVQFIELTGLLKFSTYNISVAASTSVGIGPSESVTVSTDTDVPSAPLDVQYTNLSSTSIQVTWDPPSDINGVFQRYIIMVTRLEPRSSSNQTLDTSNVNVTMFNITGLEEYERYTIVVYGETDAGVGPGSEPLDVLTDEGAPTVPLNFTVERIASQSEQLNAFWSSPEDSNGILLSYNVSCRTTTYQFYPEQNFSTISISTDGDTTSTIIMGLDPFTMYQCQVTASTDAGESPVSNSDNATTDEAAPTQPVGLSATNRTATSISLQWSRPIPTNGIITTYTLTYTDGSISDTMNIPVEFVSPSEYNVTTITVDSLNEFTNYTFNLSATTGGGTGPVAILPDVLTSEAVPSAAPVNVTGMNTSSTSLRISWLPPPAEDQNGIITAYNITYTAAGGSEMIDSTSGSVQFIELTGLLKFSTYNISVAASTSVGIGPSESVTVSTDTDVPSAPLGVQYTNLSSTSIQVIWDPPSDINGVFQRYIIMVTRLDPRNSNNQTLDTSNVNVTMFNVTGLEEYERYTIVVYGETDAGVGPGSEPLDVLTDEGVPSEPRNVTLGMFNATAINVTWMEPSSLNGVITHYTITYIGTKTNSNNNFGGMINTNLFANVSASSQTFLLTSLLSDTMYKANVTAFTSVGAGSVGIGNNIVKLPIGRPPQINISEPSDPSVPPSVTDNSITVSFMIPEEANANGLIMRYRIVVRLFGSNNNTIETHYASFRFQPPGQAPPYQAVEQTPRMQGRKRQSEAQDETVIIGDPEMVCRPDDKVCNGPLNPNTEYQFKYRLYTNDDNNQFVESGYSMAISTATASPNTATIIIAVVISVALLIAIFITIIVVLIIYRSKRDKGGKYDFMKTNGGSVGQAGSKSSTENNIPLVASGPSIVPLSDNLPHTKTVAPKSAGKVGSHTRKVYMRDLPGYMSDMMSDSGYKFSEEYEKVTAVGLEHSKDASLMPENRAKNRYTNILAYDHSRVKLSSIDDEPGSDYINANYIPGYRMRRAYIATQGPLPSTFDDFWNMAWEQNTHNIVMLTQLVERGRTKCHRYWPGTQSEVYGDITVEMMSEKELADWTFRELRLTKEKRSRTVKHFQFTSWPDHGVPETPSSVLDFVREVRGSVQGPHGPMVIHCSAGVGRTGTFVGLDTLLQHTKDHDWVDIFGLACEMRLHRNHMIQTEAQYVFIHKSMLELCEYLTAYKSSGNKLDFSPIYANTGINSQTDMYGDLLSEEVGQEKSYDETKM